jgi:branched-chain amino acid transport system substrate-binding protein
MKAQPKLALKPLALTLAAALSAALSIPAAAQYSNDNVKIGLLTDMSGVYSDISGQGGVEAVKMAIADFGGTVNGKKIEFIYADHLNKADIGASKAREWIDQQGVDVLMPGANSAVVLAMNKIATEKKKPLIVPPSATATITNEECSPYAVHYGYDTVSLAKGTASAIMKQGSKTWYFITADYVFGHSLENDATKVVIANGGKVLGAARHPLSAPDFSSFILQAKNSKADVLAFANASGDLINAIKSANEFGIGQQMKLAGMIIFLTDVHSLGLKDTQGMYLTDSWYWDQDNESRAWAKRYQAVMKKMPVSLHAATYSATLTYLKAVQAAGSDDGDKVMAELRKMRVNDMYTKNAWLRADGRMMTDMKLIQVKTPAESKQPWDYYKVLQKIPAEEAFTTKADSKCALWK